MGCIKVRVDLPLSKDGESCFERFHSSCSEVSFIIGKKHVYLIKNERNKTAHI